MDTTTILAFRHPSQVGLLLESLVTSMNWVTPQAHKAIDRSELPAALQRIAMVATKSNRQWAAWFQNEVARLYVVRPATEYSRSVRQPALELSVYNDRGTLRHQGLWVSHHGGWQCQESKQIAAVTTSTVVERPTKSAVKTAPWYRLRR